MTRDKAIAELVRIWHSPHLDLMLKAGLAEAIETLKENNQSDSLVRDEAGDCKESESKLDLISKQKTIEQLLADNDGIEREDAKAVMVCLEDVLEVIDEIPIAEPKTGEWVWSDEDASWMCGACCCVFEEIDWKPNYNYCPNCGARMNGGEEE